MGSGVATRKSEGGRVLVGVGPQTWNCARQDRLLTVRALASPEEQAAAQAALRAAAVARAEKRAADQAAAAARAEKRAAALAEELALVQEIFAAFDIDADGKISKDE